MIYHYNYHFWKYTVIWFYWPLCSNFTFKFACMSWLPHICNWDILCTCTNFPSISDYLFLYLFLLHSTFNSWTWLFTFVSITFSLWSHSLISLLLSSFMSAKISFHSLYYYSPIYTYILYCSKLLKFLWLCIYLFQIKSTYFHFLTFNLLLNIYLA